MRGFSQHGWKHLGLAMIAGISFAALSLPIAASAQRVPEVGERCRWVKDCETYYETEQRCQAVQQCQAGHCYPVEHCFDVKVPHRSCYPRQVCR